MEKTYLVYLDEFGHIGPYIARTHRQYNTSPVFGFGGIVIPADQIRPFSSWFFNLKCNLLSFEIERDRIPSFRWEKKGASLYTTTNIVRYKELRKATFRMLNKLQSIGGFVHYVGLQKTADPVAHRPDSMSLAVLKDVIRRLDQFCMSRDAGFLIFLDHREGKVLREAVVGVTQREMYGEHPRRTLLEAPTQVESHLYQTMQAADWVCGLIGRLEAFRARPDEFQDMEWSERYFGERIKMAALRSGVRKQANVVPDAPPTKAAKNDENYGSEADFDDTTVAEQGD